jgi:hypothetical protein
MNVEIGRQILIILFWKYRGRAVSFLGIHKSEPNIYTFILDSHQPFICGAGARATAVEETPLSKDHWAGLTTD